MVKAGLKNSLASRHGSWSGNLQGAIADPAAKALAGIDEICSIIDQMRGIGTDAETGNYIDAQRAANHQISFGEIRGRIATITAATRDVLNTAILQGPAIPVKQFGAETTQTVTFTAVDVQADALGINASSIATVPGTTAAITALDTAAATLAHHAATLSTFVNFMEAKSNSILASQAAVEDTVDELTTPQSDKISSELAETGRDIEVAYAALGQANNKSQSVATSAATILSQ